MFLISLIVTGNSHMVSQNTLFILISNVRVAITVSFNGSHGLGINLDNPSTYPNLFELHLKIII